MVAIVSSLVAIKSSLSLATQQTPSLSAMDDSSLHGAAYANPSTAASGLLDALNLNTTHSIDSTRISMEDLKAVQLDSNESDSTSTTVAQLQDALHRFLTGLNSNLVTNENDNTDSNSDTTLAFSCLHCTSAFDTKQQAGHQQNAEHHLGKELASRRQDNRMLLRHKLAADIPLSFHTTISIWSRNFVNWLITHVILYTLWTTYTLYCKPEMIEHVVALY